MMNVFNDKIIKQFKKKTQKYCHTYTESVSPRPSLFDDKIGGQPYIPKGIPYPKTSTGKDMALLLQINLSNHKLGGFPRKGFFEFFHDSNFEKGAEYKFFIFDENLEHLDAFPEIDYSNFICKEPVHLSFKKEMCYMNVEDINFEPTVLQCISEVTKKIYKSLDDFFAANGIEDKQDFFNKFKGKGFNTKGIGVWPDFIDKDIRTKEQKDLANIFQFETSENINIGKNGKGWIFIDKEELRTGFIQNAKFEWRNS